MLSNSLSQMNNIGASSNMSSIWDAISGKPFEF